MCTAYLFKMNIVTRSKNELFNAEIKVMDGQ